MYIFTQLLISESYFVLKNNWTETKRLKQILKKVSEMWKCVWGETADTHWQSEDDDGDEEDDDSDDNDDGAVDDQ